MTVTIELSPAGERRLKAKAERQGVDRESVASTVLEQALALEDEDYEQAVAGIQRGLDDFSHGRYRSFAEFAEEQRQKYGIHSDR